MQIAQEVRRVLHDKPNEVKLSDFKLEFGRKVTRVLSKEDYSTMARSIWKARLEAATRNRGK